MKKRPVLMSAPMVRATLEDRKTQTRRMVKIAARFHEGRPSRDAWEYFRDVKSCFVEFKGEVYAAEQDGTLNAPAEFCPYGQVGDRLWVRENFSILNDGIQPPRIVFFADMESEAEAAHHKPWKPSIFMPRGVSRILLEITEVRVQRLQDISFEDAMSEGITIPPMTPGHDVDIDGNFWPSGQRKIIQAFQDLWESINGKRPGCTWKDNPWVWVVSFKRVKP